MKNRNRIIGAGIIVFVILVALTYPLWSPYFIDEEVNEAFPELSDEFQAGFDDMPQEQQDILLAMREENMDEAVQMTEAMLGENRVVPDVDQAMPDGMPAEPVILSMGNFVDLDPVHGAQGTATIYDLPDGRRFLRLEDFRSTNGPDLHVLLADGTSPRNSGALGDYIDLGELKGNVGNQNYEILADVDLSLYNSVVIYCLPFHVVFSYADLSEPS